MSVPSVIQCHLRKYTFRIIRVSPHETVTLPETMEIFDVGAAGGRPNERAPGRARERTGAIRSIAEIRARILRDMRHEWRWGRAPANITFTSWKQPPQDIYFRSR